MATLESLNTARSRFVRGFAALACIVLLGAQGDAFARQKGPLYTPIILFPVSAAPLFITPSTASVPQNGQQPFAASGGVPPYSFSLVAGTDTSGGASIDATTGLYTAGPNPGTTTVRVTDSATPTPNHADATVTVVALTTQVDVSLDGQALGPGVTMSIAPQGGGAPLYTGLTTDRVQELQLSPAVYTLTTGAVSLNFTVNAACDVTLP